MVENMGPDCDLPTHRHLLRWLEQHVSCTLEIRNLEMGGSGRRRSSVQRVSTPFLPAETQLKHKRINSTKSLTLMNAGISGPIFFQTKKKPSTELKRN